MIVLADILSGVNIVLALVVVYYQIKFIRRARKPAFDWIKILFAIVGAYWAVIYFWVLFSLPISYDAVTFGQVFIRPAFTFTLSVMVAAAVQREKDLPS